MDTNGVHVRQLTSGDRPGQNWRPSWSPDGRRICFVSNRHDGCSRLYTINGDGSEQEQLMAIPDVFDDWPDWCPVDDRIAFSRGNHVGLEDVYVLDLGSGEEQRLTSDETLDFCASWSPDARLIAFRRTLGDPSGIYVIPADGGEPWLLTGGYYPSWSPEGDRLAYSYGGDMWSIAVGKKGRAAGDPMQLTSDPDTYDRHPSWSPDAARIAFQSKVWEANRCHWHILTMRADGSDIRDLGEGEQPAWSPRPEPEE